MHNIVNVLNGTEQYTLTWLIVCYVNVPQLKIKAVGKPDTRYKKKGDIYKPKSPQTLAEGGNKYKQFL